MVLKLKHIFIWVIIIITQYKPTTKHRQILQLHMLEPELIASSHHSIADNFQSWGYWVNDRRSRRCGRRSDDIRKSDQSIATVLQIKCSDFGRHFTITACVVNTNTTIWVRRDYIVLTMQKVHTYRGVQVLLCDCLVLKCFDGCSHHLRHM